MTEKITQIQFRAPLEEGAAIVASVFASLPLAGEEAAWLSRQAAAEYCEQYPPERADIGNYKRPTVPRPGQIPGGEEPVEIITPSSGRGVAFYAPSVPSAAWAELWTVNFGPDGSTHAAGELLAAIAASPGASITNIARHGPHSIYHSALT